MSSSARTGTDDVAQSTSRGRVLLMERDPLVVAHCRAVFDRLRLELREAQDASQARQCLMDESFDVVMADEFAWGTIGIEMLTDALDRQPYARRILVSSRMDASTLDRALRVAKVDGLLRKPLSDRDLEDILRLLFAGALFDRKRGS